MRIKFNAPILKVTAPSILKPGESNKKKVVVTETACKDVVKNFKDNLIVVVGETPAGVVEKLIYNEEEKQVYAEISLCLNAFPMADPAKSKFLELAYGKQLVSLSLQAVALASDMPTINEKLKKDENTCS